MPIVDQKKSTNYGVLCGLRADVRYDSDSSTISSPSSKDNSTSIKTTQKENIEPQRRPQSLTLPFENRDRESHLVSEEDFDRILKQEEMNNQLPPLPSGINRNALESVLRRSISTARNTRLSMLSERPRPQSTDLSKIVAEQQGQEAQNQRAIPRDPTLTALPRPPTRNDLLVYPDQVKPDQQPQSRGYTQALRHDSRMTNDKSLQVHEDQPHDKRLEGMTRRHKRHFSAADMVDSLKKRLKRENAAVPSTNAVGHPVDRSSPLVDSAAISYAILPQNQPIVSAKVGEDNENNDETPIDFQTALSQTISNAPPPTPASSPNSTPIKSLLERTWHAAKHSLSTPTPLNLFTREYTGSGCTHSTATPTPPPTPISSILSSPSPLSSRTNTAPSPSPTQPYEYISGPTPRPSTLTRLGAPPRRRELNTVVSRQQSRIVDLTLQNNVLVSQIELLRREVEGMSVGAVASRGSGGRSHQEEKSGHGSIAVDGRGTAMLRRERVGDFQHFFAYGEGGKRPMSSSEMGVVDEMRRSRGVGVGADDRDMGARIESFDPQGWRRIMGVKSGEDGHVDGEGEVDKRKTWMTCDS